MSYLTKSNRSGFKIGDRVEVIRTAESYEWGWDNTWVDSMGMRQKYTITCLDYGKGFHLNDGFSYPYFVLQHINIKGKGIPELHSKFPEFDKMVQKLQTVGT